MFKNIEKTYKEKSAYNIIGRKTFFVYSVFIIISLIFNYLNWYFFVIIAFALMIYMMKKICESVLRQKLKIDFSIKKNDNFSLNKLIINSEKELFKNYLINNNLYNEKSLLCIVNHYRCLLKEKIIGSNLLPLLSLAIPTVLSFYSKDGWNFQELNSVLPFLVSFIILITLLYYSYNKFIEMKSFLKGEDGMFERLEELFSELYIEYEKPKAIKKSKKKAVKQTKKISE